jgi:hypothetical protein
VTEANRSPDAPLKPLTRRVIVEVPFLGENNLERNGNLAYLSACVADCLLRGEAPMAVPLSVVCGVTPEAAELVADSISLQWRPFADATVAYVDRGVTPAMKKRLQAAADADEVETCEMRELGPKWAEVLQNAPVYLGLGDSAIVWDQKEQRFSTQAHSVKDEQLPPLMLALMFVINQGSRDSRLEREMIRFVERINSVAGDMKRAAERAALNNRS